MFRIVKLEQRDKFCSDVPGAFAFNLEGRNAVCACAKEYQLLDVANDKCVYAFPNPDCDQATDLLGACTYCEYGSIQNGLCVPLYPARYFGNRLWCPLGYVMDANSCVKIKCEEHQLLYGNHCYVSTPVESAGETCSEFMWLIDHENANIYSRKVCLAENNRVVYFNRYTGLYEYALCKTQDNLGCTCADGNLLFVQEGEASCVPYDASISILHNCYVRTAVLVDEHLHIECLRYNYNKSGAMSVYALIAIYLTIGVVCVVAMVITVVTIYRKSETAKRYASFIDYYSQDHSEQSLASSQAYLYRYSSLYI